MLMTTDRRRFIYLSVGVVCLQANVLPANSATASVDLIGSCSVKVQVQPGYRFATIKGAGHRPGLPPRFVIGKSFTKQNVTTLLDVMTPDFMPKIVRVTKIEEITYNENLSEILSSQRDIFKDAAEITIVPLFFRAR